MFPVKNFNGKIKQEFMSTFTAKLQPLTPLTDLKNSNSNASSKATETLFKEHL